jgi:hypothetical protein
MRTSSNRALIYVRGTDPEVEEQLSVASAICQRRGYEIVAVLREQPGEVFKWQDAHRLIRHGKADRVIMASALNAPDILESATGSLPGPRLRQGGGVHRATRRRRIRPVPRPGAAT